MEKTDVGTYKRPRLESLTATVKRKPLVFLNEVRQWSGCQLMNTLLLSDSFEKSSWVLLMVLAPLPSLRASYWRLADGKQSPSGSAMPSCRAWQRVRILRCKCKGGNLRQQNAIPQINLFKTQGLALILH